MIVLLAGTGVLGSALAELLIRNEEQVLVISRSEPRILGVKWKQVDVYSISTITDVLGTQEFKIFIDYAIDVQGSRVDLLNLVQSRNAKYIFISTCRVLSGSWNSMDDILDSSVLPKTEYVSKKLSIEKLVLNSSVDSLIYRPYISYGVNRFSLFCLEFNDWMGLIQRGREIPFPLNHLHKNTTLNTAENVALDLYNRLSQNGVVYDSSGITITWHQVIKELGEYLLDEFDYRLSLRLLSDNDYRNLCQNYYQFDFDRIYNRSFGKSSGSVKWDNVFIKSYHSSLKPRPKLLALMDRYERRHSAILSLKYIKNRYL